MFLLDNEARKRYAAFWDRDSYERCTMYIYCRDVHTSILTGASVTDKWTDMELRSTAAMEKYTDNSYFAEGFPTFFVNFGPGSLAACIGGNYELAESTIWFDLNPVIKDWDNMPLIEFNEQSEMWKMTTQLSLMAAERSQGKYSTSLADIGGSLDILSSLRGPQQLLIDLIDYPEEVKALHDRVNEYWKVAFTKLYNIIRPYQMGTSSWMSLWCEQRYYPLQCDFCAMISPDMFAEFVKPYLSSQAEFLDHSVYHLDGPDAVRHLDHLLDIPALDAIQWTPGTGKAPMYDESYFDMYNKIIDSGKSLVLFSIPLDKLENLLKNVRTKGLFVEMRVNDEKEAKEAIKIANSYGVK